jgi:predicted aldo/keto reductase-like oxidoreductase
MEDIMQKRLMDRIGEWTSLLGFGCMRFPWKDGKIDAQKVQRMVDYAKSHGVNYFDTAYVYDNGESEKAIGKALQKYPRSSYFLADKLPSWEANEPGDLEKIFNTSLERLGTDYIDFYLIHALEKKRLEDVKKLNIIDFLKKKRAEGKIKYIGFSFHDSTEVFREIIDMFDWDFAQIQLNYFDWKFQHADELYEILAEKNVPCIVMEPIRGGRLINLSKEVSDIFKEANSRKTPAQWALDFVASHPQVKVILSGMSNLKQVKENVKTLSNFTPMTQTEYDAIEKAAAYMQSQPQIRCTDCHYCLPCPNDVNIPGCFWHYNEYMLSKSEQIKDKYLDMAKSGGPDKCVKCGLCATRCPQHIDIPNQLDIVKKVFS